LGGTQLEDTIRKARFSIYPSEWYENCPFSVMESIQYGTPVLGADIGGIPELIDAGVTGELFASENENELLQKITEMWNKCQENDELSVNCLKKRFASLEEYCNDMQKYYF